MQSYKMMALAGTLLSAGVAASAVAGVNEGSVAQASATLSFSPPGTVHLTLMPYPSPGAGKIEGAVTLASGRVEAGTGNIAAVRWTPDIGDALPGDDDGYKRVIHGDSNARNQLVVQIVREASPLQSGGQGWLMKKKGTCGPCNKAEDILFWIRTPGNLTQTVAEDSYTLSLDAAVWRD